MKSLSKKLSARILSFAIAIVGMSAGPMANAACDAPPAGIVAWWPGQGNANDIIGTNNGTPVGGLVYTNGEVGQAFSLDGTSTYVSVLASPSLDIGASSNGLTIEGWINPGSITMEYGAPIIEWDSGSTIGLQFWTIDSLFASITDTAGNAHILQSAGGLITQGVLQHVALTYNPTSGIAVLYCNGSAVTNQNLGSFVTQTTYPLNIGRRSGSVIGDGYNFDGVIDELSLYNRALSSNEIAAIYNAGSAGKCQPVGLAPVITSQPTNLTVNVSNTATFTATATGTAPLHYQWSFNHTNLLGATNAILTLPNVQLTQAGSYSVTVSNFVGTTNSRAALLTVVNPTPPSCDAPPAGIVAWWPAQGNANDIIGGNNGSPVGTVSYTNGEVGEAFSFNGTSYLVISNQPALNPTNAMTVECWAYTRGHSLPQTWGQQLVSKDSDCNGTRQFELEFADSQIQSGSPDFRGAIWVPGGVAVIDGATVPQTNTWYHVAMTYDGTTFKLYVNGALDGQLAATGGILAYPEPVRLGGGGDGGCEQLDLNGLLDEPSIYNRALSQAEIQAIYLAGSAGKCQPVGLAPIITSQPTNLTVNTGSTAAFTVTATGTAPLHYQWSFNHTNLLGATNAILSLPNVQLTQAGSYSVIVSNFVGSTNSRAAILTVVNPTPPSCDAPPAGIVAWWPGQGNATDIIGGNNGTPVGGLAYTNGEVGQAFSLDGTSTYVSVPASPSLDIGASSNGLTIEGWIAPGPITMEYTAPIIEWDSGSAIGLQFWASDSLWANLVDTAGNNHVLQSPSGLITQGVLQHVALTYNPASGMAVLYCNGNAVLTQNLGSLVLQTTYPPNIGRRNGNVTGNGYNFEGAIDELSLYNRALSSNEIAAIYLAGSAGKCQPVGLAPVITSQPTNLTVNTGSTAAFTVTATGTAPLHYQWSLNHTNLLGATNALLTLSNVQLTQAGSYSVTVSNFVGSTNSRAAILTVVNPTPPSCDAPPAGIVAWWPGQGNANDIIGTNNGTPVGGLVYTNGEVGQAFSLDGTSTYVSVPASPSLDIGASSNGLTIEGWINPGPITMEYGAPVIEWDSGSAIGLQFWASDSLFASLTDTAGNTHILQTAGSLISGGVLQHVALTYNQISGTAVLYCNGHAVLTQNVGSFVPQTTYPLNIGRRTGSVVGDGYNFDGVIDELSLYKRALTSNEIAAIYLAGSAGKCAGPTETVLTMVATNAMSGSTVIMPVYMNAVGTENTFLASVGYDPTKLVLNHVQLGKATAGAYLAEVDSQTNNGHVGFAILLDIGATVPAGMQEVADLVFQSIPSTNITTATLTFGDNPTPRQVVDNDLNLLPAAYFGGSITLTPAEYEADVYPRFTGNHQLNVQDWLEVGRMVAGLDTPTNQDEFDRADCAPRNAPDSVLTVADWVQAGRYALGLDPLTLVMPAQHPVVTLDSTSQDNSSSGRILFISNVSAQRGQAVTVPIELVCTTNENAVGLTANYNPNQLQLTGVTLGSAMADGRLNVNSNLLTGQLGLTLALPPGATLPAGTNQVAILQFIASTSASGAVVVTLDDSVVTLQVADQLANALPTVYANGAVILPAQPPLAATGMAHGLQLSWPVTSGAFQVQAADSPIGPWTTVSLPIITNGPNATVTVSPTNQQQYFRLQGQ